MSVQATSEDAPRLIVAPDYEALSRRAARVVADTVRRRPRATISLTTGRTPLGLYRTLRHWCGEGRLDLSGVRIVSSEEYVGVGVDADDPVSLFGWLRAEVLKPCGIAEESVLRLAGDAADPAAECRRFDAAIERWGGIDLVVQSIGVNGHFGFNEPGSAPDAGSRVVVLAPSTLESNARYWPDGARLPTHGLAMGVGVTLRARHVLLLAAGKRKAEALARAVDGPIDAAVPCSLLRLAPRLTVLADVEASAALEHVDTGAALEHADTYISSQ